MSLSSASRAAVLTAVDRVLAEPDQGLIPGELTALIGEVLERRENYLAAAREYGTPQYLFEEERLQRSAGRFTAAFSRPGQQTRVHYAFKANPSLPLVRAVHRAGLSADASSGLELELALRCGFEHVVLSGPAKTDEELSLALRHRERVTVHLDSFRELERLEALAGRQGVQIDAGIRLNTQGHGLWTKFGIPLDALPELVQRAGEGRQVRLRGVQFHLSWNRNAAGYLRTLTELGPVLQANAPPGGWAFVDIGGGYYPEDDEAVYPWLTPTGRLLSQSDQAPAEGPPADWDLQYLLHTVQPIEEMAGEILDTFAPQVVDRLGPVALWLEPGRYLANQAVHLILRVTDVKAEEIAITDGGTNLLGWERLESEHCPLINLSRPASSQVRCRVYGSLCTPHDLWGFACYGSGIEVGDLLILPAQGSYVQTLAQRFIKPICQTVVLEPGGTTTRAQAAETFLDRYPEFRGSADLP